MKSTTKSLAKPTRRAEKQDESRKIEPGSSYEAFKRLETWVESIPDEVFASVPNDASMRYEEYLYGEDSQH